MNKPDPIANPLAGNGFALIVMFVALAVAVGVFVAAMSVQPQRELRGGQFPAVSVAGSGLHLPLGGER